MKETWDSRISRAERLASERPESKELLAFYAALLGSQKEIYEYLRTRKGWLPSGALERDLPVLRVMLPALLRRVESSGPDPLATGARSLKRARSYCASTGFTGAPVWLIQYVATYDRDYVC